MEGHLCLVPSDKVRLPEFIGQGSLFRLDLNEFKDPTHLLPTYKAKKVELSFTPHFSWRKISWGEG